MIFFVREGFIVREGDIVVVGSSVLSCGRMDRRCFEKIQLSNISRICAGAPLLRVVMMLGEGDSYDMGRGVC